MSDHYLILIPEKAGHVPAEEMRAHVQEKFRAITQPLKVEAELTEFVRFEHAGGNTGRIFCPDCGTELNYAWWGERMDQDFGEEKSFKLNPVVLPCCGAKRGLHDLKYESPQGFARFSLSALEPEMWEIQGQPLIDLETAAGCKLRVIFRRI
jgi:hypothetical protein